MLYGRGAGSLPTGSSVVSDIMEVAKNVSYNETGRLKPFYYDQKKYLGNQLESEFGEDRCFGILAGMDFILVCTYEKDGKNPELLIYKKR